MKKGFSLAGLRIISYICSEEKVERSGYKNVTIDIRRMLDRTGCRSDGSRKAETKEEKEIA